MTEEQSRKTEATLGDILGVGRSPEVPAPAQRARAQAEQLVKTITEEALANLQARRDEIDNLMQRIQNGGESLVDWIGAFTSYSCNTINVSAGISDALKIISEPFPTKPPATFTQRSNNGNGH